jgi:predicted MFS family arabinose efflux permease
MSPVSPRSIRHWRRQSAAGLGAQLTHGAAAVGIALVSEQATGSFALAGAVVGVFGLGAGIARPIQGRLIDQRGVARVLALCGVVHSTVLVSMAVAGHGGAPVWALLALGLLAGAAIPPVSASMRVAWGDVASPEDRSSAFSMVTLTQELAILLGPLGFGLLAIFASVRDALIVVAVLAGACNLMLAALLPLAPPRRSHSRNRPRVLRAPRMLTVLVTAALLGLGLGAVEIAAPALAVAEGRPAAAGLLIAALSAGGAVGAVLYSAFASTAPPPGLLRLLLGGFSVALVPLVWIDDLLVAGIVLGIAGVPMNPALTVLALLVDELVSVGTAEAFGWLSTAIAAGAAVGTALAGVATEELGGARAAFVIAAAGGALGALMGAGRRSASRRRLRSRVVA